MIHTLQNLLTTLLAGLTAHLEEWVGWAALIAAALFGFRGASRWMPLVVALIVNPAPYGLVAGLLHGRAVGLNAAATFTAIQIVIAYAGFLIGRLATRLR